MSQRNTKPPWLKKGWIKLLDEQEQKFVAWFKGEYGREPNYQDVEERWDDFERQLSKGDR